MSKDYISSIVSENAEMKRSGIIESDQKSNENTTIVTLVNVFSERAKTTYSVYTYIV